MEETLKNKHIVLRYQNMFCAHCGTSQDIQFPVSKIVFAEYGEDFTKRHTDCKKTWKQPFPDQTKTEEDTMIQLGSTVTEAISGFTGIASGRCEYLTGCTRILVQPLGLDKDGKKKDSLWLDEQRLTVDKRKSSYRLIILRHRALTSQHLFAELFGWMVCTPSTQRLMLCCRQQKHS